MTYESFLHLFAECSGLEPKSIDSQLSIEQLGVKSLQMAEFAVALESEGQVSLASLLEVKSLPLRDAYAKLYPDALCQ